LKEIYALMKREFKSYFSTPLAYPTIVIFLFFSSLFFVRRIYYHLAAQNLTITEGIIAPLTMIEAIILTIIIPLITMRLLSEERKGGTAELLLTSPISTLQVVLGKYLASLLVLAIMLLLTFPFIVFLYYKGSPELGPILSGYLGLFLLGGIFLSIGLFTSSLTENQIVSAIICLIFLLLIWAEDHVRQISGPILADFLGKISIIEAIRDFSFGVIDTKNLVFFISIIAFFLFLTQRVIDSNKWR
jgi:ABC-2 type transport system permease protein